jgi:histidyl-tRNA synthetase
MSQIQAIRGFNDLLPQEASACAYIEQRVREIADQYDYHEIRCPILEKTELFIRGVGEVTDIVEKEMYSFTDRNDGSLSLRPEGTAGCVRAGIEHGLLYNQIQRFWYTGPMFRHERPQAGRYRQFYHIGFEAFGVADPYIDAELILMTVRLWHNLGLLNKLTLQINSLGTPAARQNYRQVLLDYLLQHEDQLDQDSKKRLQRNPLRILDSKNPAMADLIANAPRILDYLTPESLAHFTCLQKILTENKVNFVVNQSLVRGLDYYSDTVFEWVTTELGAQGTVCAGGRYDGLVAQLGGHPTPAIGFAMGVERVLLLLQANQLLPEISSPWIYILSIGADAKVDAVRLAELLRNQFATVKIINDTSSSSLKSQMKRADKSGAQMALIIGEEEGKTDTISVKFLRQTIAQQSVTRSNLVEFLRTHYGT